MKSKNGQIVTHAEIKILFLIALQIYIAPKTSKLDRRRIDNDRFKLLVINLLTSLIR